MHIWYLDKNVWTRKIGKNKEENEKVEGEKRTEVWDNR